jgi:hypothetical protein
MLLLMAVASNVDQRHEGCSLSIRQFASATLLPEETVPTGLAMLARLALIVPGDQNLSAGFPLVDRPVVWDLNIRGQRALNLQGRASGNPAMDIPGAVYRLLDRWGRLLYVGSTVELDQRWAKHRPNVWWPEVVDIQVVWYPSLHAAWVAEQKAIHQEAPIHNVARYAHDWADAA